MASVLLHIEKFLSNPILWGIASIVAIALSLSGRFSMTASTVLMWIACAMASFGAYRIFVYFGLDLILRLLATVASACVCCIASLLLVRWMNGKPAASENAPSPTPVVATESSIVPQPVAPIREAARATVSHTVQLMFKDSPLLTTERRKMISREMDGVASYLKSFSPLGIPIPDEIPPIGVETANPKGTGWRFGSQSGDQYYYNVFMLQPGMLDDRQKVTEAFLTFAIGRFLYRPTHPLSSQLDKMSPEEFYAATHTPEQMDQIFRWRASGMLGRYLNHSYWNNPPGINERPVCPDQGDGTTYYLWLFRERFGKDLRIGWRWCYCARQWTSPISIQTRAINSISISD